MKTIGLIGGMSWESSLEYYRFINEMTKEVLGDTHSCQSLMYTFDFDHLAKLQHDNQWEDLTDLMVKAAKDLKAGGADFIVICTNTMHMMAKDIEQRVGIDVLHICDATAEEIKKKGLKKVALLGTKFTMMGDFYKDKFVDDHGIDILIPSKDDMEKVHSIIYNELILGKILPESKKEYIRIIEGLAKQGAQGVILGCTEIPLLIQNEDVSIPVFDTTRIHANAAVRFAME